MVRASGLPLRLSCLKYGAGLVYSGVLVDRSILETVRVENETFGVTDFVSPREKRAIWSTCAEEREKLIFQVGTADASMAIQAALHVCRDVRGIDVNMGCMAPFSATGGMGAALLDKPEVVADILRTLRRELPAGCAVSCKVRMLPTLAKTLDFLQLIERSGADAVAIHLRTQAEGQAGNTLQYTKPAHWEDASMICSSVSIPVIANGDFLSRERINQFWSSYGPDSLGEGESSAERRSAPAAIMIARGALWNPGIFYRQGHIGPEAEQPSHEDAIRTFVRNSVRTNTTFENTKWVVREMLNGNGSFMGLAGRELGKFKVQVDGTKCTADICGLFSSEPHNPSDYPPQAHTLKFYKDFKDPVAMVSQLPET